MDEKHLKPPHYYSDLYDRQTVERCRRTEASFKDLDLGSYKDKKTPKKELERMRESMKKFCLQMEAGEMYLNKAATIRKWIEADEERDRLMENAQPPEDIRCLTCRNRVIVTYKSLWTELDKEDRLLFMFDCPNKCLPRRAFFNDGEEWRPKPRLCPQCETKLSVSENDDGTKLVTTLTCPKCAYTKTEVLEWSHKKDEEVDEHFAEDRDRFCLTEKQGAEYSDMKYRMEGFARLGKEFEEKEKERAKKLEENPKGYRLEGAGYTCFICGGSTPEGDNWYDKWGIKCLTCQWAIDHGEIPASLAKNKESWYTKWDLESAFNVKSPTLRKWIKEGILKARTISSYGKGTHYEMYLIKDNKDFLPPKKLVERRPATEEKNGEMYHISHPWYQCVKDPFEYLKDYGIMKRLRIVPAEEVAEREAERKRKWEEKQARKAARPKRTRKVKRKGVE